MMTLKDNLLFSISRLGNWGLYQTPPTHAVAWVLCLELETALNVSCSSICLLCDGILDTIFTRLPRNQEALTQVNALFSLFFWVYMCVFPCACLAVPDLAALQTSTNVSGGAVGSHSIEEAPGSSEAFLSATWLNMGCSVNTPLHRFPPGSKPPPKLQRSPNCWQLSMLPFLLSNSPRPASISRRYSIHRRRALITKQDYGLCLRTTCQGACSLFACSPRLTHFRGRFCLCVFGKEVEIWLQMATQSKSLWNLSKQGLS